MRYTVHKMKSDHTIRHPRIQSQYQHVGMATQDQVDRETNDDQFQQAQVESIQEKGIVGRKSDLSVWLSSLTHIFVFWGGCMAFI